MTRANRFLLLFGFILLIAGCSGRIPLPVVPDRYVVAYVVDSPPFRVNTRFSDNGINWSSPIEVRDLGLPATAPQGIPAGIGAKPDQYLVAWFDSGVLRTAISSDAANWSHPTSHGSFNVHARSKPAIEWNFNTRKWIAAFVLASGQIAIVDVSGSRGESTLVSGVTTPAAPSLVWQNNALHLIFADSSARLRYITSSDGEVWAPTGGALLLLSPGGSDLRGGLFTVIRSSPRIFLAHSITRGTDIHRADTTVYEYDNGTLTLDSTIQRTYLDSLGPVAIGPDGARSVIDAGARGTTLWHEGVELSSFTTPRVRAVAAAYGPSVGRSLPQFRCGPCNKCIQSAGVNLTDYRRTCVTETGQPSDFTCLVCGACEHVTGLVGSHRRCNPPRYGSDAPGQSPAEARIEQCGLCPPN